MRSIEIIKDYDVENYLSVLLRKNTSNKAPYHNFNHIMCVVKNVYEIAMDLKIEESMIRNLIIAAIFRDINHSQGIHKDDVNIKRAVKMFKDNTVESIENNHIIISIIEATQYPYVINVEDLSLEQKIIRDADLMQTFEENYIQQVIFGLSEEMNLELKDLLEGQIKFLENSVYHTGYAKSIANKYLPIVKSEVETLIKLI